MITTSANYNTIFADPGHYAEVKLKYGTSTEVGEDSILSCERSQSLFGGNLGPGNTVMNQIQFSLIGEDPLPTKTRVEAWARIATDSNTVSEWLPMGVYYTRKPDYDPGSQIQRVVGYDAMWKTGTVPFENGFVMDAWNNPSLRQVARHITLGTTVSDVIDTSFEGIGLVIDNVTDIPDDIYMPAPPFGYTVREILQEIAIASGGNWTIRFMTDNSQSSRPQLERLHFVYMTYTDRLRIAQDLERSVMSYVSGDTVQPVSTVKVYYGYDGNGVAQYATSTSSQIVDGREYQTELKTITSGTEAQSAADELVAALRRSYIPYTSSGCELNMACELGDYVKIDNNVCLLGAITTTFGKGMFADIGCPGIPVDDDFPELSSGLMASHREEVNNIVNGARITVNADAIEAEVDRAMGAEGGLTNTITTTAESVTVTLKQYADDAVGDHAKVQAKYIRYSAAGLELGDEDQKTKAVLTERKLSFYSPDGDEKAYIGNDPTDDKYKFFVVNGHIVNQLELGDNWLLVASSSETQNRLTFKWRG